MTGLQPDPKLESQKCSSWWKHKHVRFGEGSESGNQSLPMRELEVSLCHCLFLFDFKCTYVVSGTRKPNIIPENTIFVFRPGWTHDDVEPVAGAVSDELTGLDRALTRLVPQHTAYHLWTWLFSILVPRISRARPCETRNVNN